MKKTIAWVLLVGLSFAAQAEDVWVSDEIEAPLRESPELNAKIIDLLSAGQRVTVLKQDKDYTQIKTASGAKGWLSNYYVLRQQSVHDQLAPALEAQRVAEEKLQQLTQELAQKTQQVEQLQGDVSTAQQSASEVEARARSSESGVEKLSAENQLLQKKLSEQNAKIAELAKALDSATEKAITANTRYKSLVKVSENVVDIDTQNRKLQEKAVQFEQELQRLKTENQSLNAQIGKKEFIIGALTILGGILVGYVLSVMMPPRGRRTGNNYSSL